MEEKKILINHFHGQYHTYLEILSWYRSEIGWYFDSGKNTIHTVPFILTCAAALECSLNDHIIKHFTGNYGDHGKLQIPGLLSMTLKGKLINIVPLLTSNKYIINVEHKIYQTLAELIKTRNRLVHNKSSYEIHDGLVKEDMNGNPYIAIPESLKNRLSDKIDPTLGIRGDIGKYHDSLEKFHELFFDIYLVDNFDGNDLIINTEDRNTAYDVNLISKE